MFFKNTEEVKVLISEQMSVFTNDSVTKSDNGFDCIFAFDLNLVKRSKHEFLPVAKILRTPSPRAQSYRVKRISACGGCLGDYRR